MNYRNRVKKLAARRRAMAPRPFIMVIRDYDTGRLCWRGGTEVDSTTGALVEVNEWFDSEPAS